MNPDFSILFPGSILQGNGISGGLGSLAEFPVRMRSPLRIFTDDFRGKQGLKLFPIQMRQV